MLPKWTTWLLTATLVVPVIASPTERQQANALASGEHYVNIRGVRLRYLVRGRGPVLVVQPGGAGWGGDVTAYVETLRPLEKSSKVVYLDPRGIGRSERLNNPSDYSISEYAEDLEALRQHLGLDRFALAGHSHGGFVALVYAARYPQRLDHLIILDSTPYLDWSDYSSWCASRPGYAEALASLRPDADSAAGSEEQFRQRVGTILRILHFHDYRTVAHVMDPILERTSFSPGPYNQWQAKEMSNFDVRPQLASITVPLLIVVGDDDIPLMRRGAAVMRDAIRRSQLLVVPAAGHWPWIERPEITLGEIRRFLASGTPVQ